MQLDPTVDDSFRNFLPGGMQEDDRSLIPRFFVKPKLMGAKSEAAKRPIYEDREYIEIVIKGQPHGIPHHEVTDEHRRRFPIAYAAFKAGKEVPLVGTPIDMLPGMGPSQALNLKAMNLRTIEDVAAVSDENTMNRMGMGARDLVNRCKAWVGEKSNESVALKDELDKERAERQALEDRLAALEKAGKPKKARRKKAKRAKPKAAPQPAAPA